MVFSDLFFLYAFIPCFVLFYFLGNFLDKNKATNPKSKEIKTDYRNLILIVFSLIFYAWGEPIYVFLLLINVIINYYVGLFIDKKDGLERKKALSLGIFLDILMLAIFKYAGFFAQILVDLGLKINVPKLALPIGISFYTFQAISYLVDVYRRQVPVQKSFKDLLLYISMFAQLVAGPIVRYESIQKEISSRKVELKDIADGIYRFAIGLGKKVILANQLGEIADQFLKTDINFLSTSGAWLGIFAYSLQIYFDFSGYSDMAIGIGRCVGFHFNENFNFPYICNSITDFWRRWHISLGSFFRDYVYIPLGGNRKFHLRNIFVVWMLTGFWHGASWNFVFWGLYFGILLIIEKYSILKIKNPIIKPFMHIYALFFVLMGWGIFYFDDFEQMKIFFMSFFGSGKQGFELEVQSMFNSKFYLLVLSVIFCLPIFNFLKKENQTNFVIKLLVTIAIIIISTILLVGATNNAFIYTRF